MRFTAGHSYAGRYNERYTKRRHWVEVDAKTGKYRACFSTYDQIKQKWCNVNKDSFYLFVAIGFTGPTSPIRIHVTNSTHYTYIEKHLSEHTFDDIQTERINKLLELSKIAYSA